MTVETTSSAPVPRGVPPWCRAPDRARERAVHRGVRSPHVGQPAREALLDLPPAAFELMDLVYRTGKPLAVRIETPAGERRLIVAPRVDPETGETYGVKTHLRPVTVAPR